MESIRGTIEKVANSTGTDKRGQPYTRWVFTIDGKNYSTFEKEIGNNFVVGQYVEMLGNQNGQYWNMETMRAIPKDQAPSEPVNDNSVVVADLLRQILAELKAINNTRAE